MKQLTQKLTQFEIINKGWNSLTKEFGPAFALKFLMSFIRGKGDSVKYYKEIWRGKSVKEIHQEILKAKKDGII